jgi:hypothetical protein
MNSKTSWLAVAVLLLSTPAAIAADGKFHAGIGLSNLELDGANSVNMSITAGYKIHSWQFSSMIQSVDVDVEGQYADSISGTDDVRNYSAFAVARLYTSNQLYFKLKQGFTDFPDAPLVGLDAEASHIGLGAGVGYDLNAGAIELEYTYPNKTIHASSIEMSYKLRF